MKKILLILSLSLSLQASFDFTEKRLKQYSELNFRWWTFKIYNAQVWTPKASKPDFKNEILLHLTYQRDISAEDLLESTDDEWKDLKLFVEGKSEKWLKQLKAIWPDVKKGDSLTTHWNGKETFFYQGNTLLGKISDQDFGPRFLKIWLHPKSKTKKLLIQSRKK